MVWIESPDCWLIANWDWGSCHLWSRILTSVILVKMVCPYKTFNNVIILAFTCSLIFSIQQYLWIFLLIYSFWPEPLRSKADCKLPYSLKKLVWLWHCQIKHQNHLHWMFRHSYFVWSSTEHLWNSVWWISRW